MIPDVVKLLVVDDREENLVALGGLLGAEGREVHLARSAREALELMLQHDYALAILDVQMPEIGGFELAELMRGKERTREIPIVFVTAGGRDAARVFRGYEAGAVDFLFKPIDPAILQGKVQTFVALHRTRLALARELEAKRAVVEELEEALRLNERLVAVLGHDLRNPLAAMLMSAEQIARLAGTERFGEGARRIVSSGRRMARLIEQLLDFARLRAHAGGFQLERREADLAELARTIVAEAELGSPGRIELSASGDPRGFWDPDRIAQVVSNLLGNAVRHGAAGAPIRLRVDGTAPGAVVLETWNAGAIPPEVLPEIFAPFRSSQRGGDGLGLGLFIVSEIVRAHGGTVEVDSAEERGTRFVVRLRRAQADGAPSPAAHGG